MPLSLSSCDGDELAELLSRAGAPGAAPAPKVRPPLVVKTPRTAAAPPAVSAPTPPAFSAPAPPAGAAPTPPAFSAPTPPAFSSPADAALPAPDVPAPDVPAPPELAAAPALPTIPPRSLVDDVRNIPEPTQSDLSTALGELVTTLGEVLSTSLFVADADGLLLAGSGPVAELAASVAAVATRSVHANGHVFETDVDAVLLRVAPDEFLVFDHDDSGRHFLIGARVQGEVSLVALRAAIGRILTTLMIRTQHA